MTDIKELFDMVTKQTEPDLDSWKEQEDRQRRAARKRKFGALAVAAVIVAIAAIAIASIGGGDDGEDRVPAGDTESSPPNVATNYYLDIATGERTPVAANLTGARWPEVSPDQRNIVFGTCCGSDALTVAALDGSARKTITPDTLDGYWGTWVDDGTILFQGRPTGTTEIGNLYLADIAIGQLTMVVDLPDRLRDHLVRSDVSPDGSTVVFDLPSGLWTAPLAGGEVTLLRKDAHDPAYAPDGSIVFLETTVCFDCSELVSDEIWIMDGDGRNARSLAEGVTVGAPSLSPDGTTIVWLNGEQVEIVDIATGDATQLGPSPEPAAWFGNDTLIVE